MTTFSKGDKVTAIDEAIDGIVISSLNGRVMVATTDGFDMSFDPKELIKTGNMNINVVQNLNQVLKEKETPKPRPFIREKKTKEIPPPEFDLHIEKLVKSFRLMSNHEILTLQMETAQRQIEFAIRNKIPKIVFIHGVGEGILKSELDFLLGRYENLYFQDGNYQKYGQGATEVVFRQNKIT